MTMHTHILLLKFLLFIFSLFCPVLSQGLTDAQINIVKQSLQEGATHSWEIGARAQALLEISVPSFSSLTPSPPQSLPSPPKASINASLADIYTIARTTVAALPPPPTNGSGQPLFIGDTSAGDPASVGIAVLIANWTHIESGGNYDYAGAATAQVQYLFGPDVPKTSDGAISHRVSQLQLWSDSVYMVPPFLAYYGMTTNDQSMLQEAYTQIKLYRNYLSNSSANGLWQHIVLGSSGNDPGYWSTGNGWAAAGMLRVLGTLKQSVYVQNFENEINDLGSWVSEIHSGMYPYLQPNGLFKNYADGFNSSNSNSSNFDDASSSALLAATVYRLALLTGNKTFIPQAELTRAALFAMNGTSAPLFSSSSSSSSPSSPFASSSPTANSTFSSPTSTSTSSSPSPSSYSDSSSAFAYTPHFTTTGWLSPVVNPLYIGLEGSQSPEGQAFVLMLHAAWRDWNAMSNAPHAKSANSSGRPSIPFPALAGIWDYRYRWDVGPVLAVATVVVACTILGDLV